LFRNSAWNRWISTGGVGWTVLITQLIPQHSRWVDVQPGVTVTARTSPIQSPDTTEVSLTPRFSFLPLVFPLELDVSSRSGSLTWVESVPPWTTSHSALTSSPTNTNSSQARPSKLLVSAPTSTLPRPPEKMPSISGFAFTPSTSFASTRCCLVLVLIGKSLLNSRSLILSRFLPGCRPGCEVLGANLTEPSLGSTLVKSFCPSVARTPMRT
jgi:hypothetical protein